MQRTANNLPTRLALWLGCLLMAVLGAGAAHAQSDDPPGRVGRLSDAQGKVWLFDTEQGQWTDAQRNRALTTGDRISTERGARAEVRIGSTELRLAGGSELEMVRLEDDRMVFQLHSGSVALRVRSREIASEVEVRTVEGRALPERAGHYRIDREDDTTYAATWRGEMRFDTRDQQVQVPAGRRAEFFQQPRDSATVVSWSAPEKDAFSTWVANDEQRDDRSASQRYVSPEMTGADDLDRYGRWDRHPDYGMVWSPTQVVVGWAPYRYGRWGWQARWGWTWIDDAPWGFAPSHYGRWVSWGGRWAWSPGVYVARPVFAPALVAWVGGPNASFSINIGGGPVVGWVPLAPRDVYVPAFRYGPHYYQQVNRPQHPNLPVQVPTGPVMYGNHGVPGAVTVVSSNVLAQRQPVAAAVMRNADVTQQVGRQQFRAEAPVGPQPSPTRVVAVPGGAQPAAVPPAPGREPSTGNPSGRVVDLRRERAQPTQALPQPAPALQQAVTPQQAMRLHNKDAGATLPPGSPAAPTVVGKVPAAPGVAAPAAFTAPGLREPQRANVAPQGPQRVNAAPAAPAAPPQANPAPQGPQPAQVQRAQDDRARRNAERGEGRGEGRDESRDNKPQRSAEPRHPQRERQNTM